MKSQKIIFTKARIHGLEKEPYWFEHKSFFACDITFSDHPAADFGNLTTIKTGDTESESQDFMKQLRFNFGIAGIHEDNEVLVLVDPNNEVSAIRNHKKSNYWIDVADKLKVKGLYNLSILSKL